MHVEGALAPIEIRLYMHICGYSRTYVIPVALDSVAMTHYVVARDQ